MPKEGLEAKEWERRLRLFAQGKFLFGRGHAPPPGSLWAKKKADVMKCPVGKATTDLFGRRVACTCGYHPETASSSTITRPPARREVASEALVSPPAEKETSESIWDTAGEQVSDADLLESVGIIEASLVANEPLQSDQPSSTLTESEPQQSKPTESNLDKSPKRPHKNDYSLRLPKQWSQNMAYEDQCWVGKNLFVSKGNLTSKLQNWWYPPPMPSPSASGVPNPASYFLRRLFLWMPKRMWDVSLTCPTCNIPERTLQSKGLYTRVRLVLDMKDYYYLAAEYHYCKACKGTFIAWDNRILERLPDGIRVKFPVVLTYKYACDRGIISLLRSRNLGNSPGALQSRLQELHSDEWMGKVVSYLSNCKRHQTSLQQFCQSSVEYQKAPELRDLPTAKWFLACYVRDVYSRLEILKAVTTSVYGTVIKIDSTKKITKKLQGYDANTASWVTNVGNEKGQVLSSVVTTSESMASLQPLADGLVNRFEKAGVQPPLLLYTDRECCGIHEGESKYRLLFNAWPNLLVRLDIFHFMRRCAVGCTSESHPLYGIFMAGLSRCIFEWDQSDLNALYAAKKTELQESGIKCPSEKAVMNAVSKKELAKHCRRRTRGASETESQLTALFDSLAAATDVLGVPLFRDEMLGEIWPEQRRHVPCLQDPPGVSLYTTTGTIKKGGKTLPVYRCARGTTSLESFHLHLARFIPGTSAGAVAFQAYLIEGLARWNEDRAMQSRESQDKVKSFNISLKHRLNELSHAVYKEATLSNFRTPSKYTGEVIGMEYLRSQTGDCPLQELDKEIDEAFGDFTMDATDGGDDDSYTDETVAHPEQSDDSGNEEDEETAVDASGIPGWDKVGKLVTALLALDGHVTNKQAAEIKQLYLNLDEYDKKPLVFTPKYRKAKGRFLKKKASGHVGTEAMARAFVTGAQVAQCPSNSRVVEAIILRLTEEAVEKRAKGPESPYLSKWKVVLLQYNTLRNTVINSRLYNDTHLQLFPVNETTISKWYKNKTRLDEVRLLLQGLVVPEPPLAANEPLPEPLQLEKSSVTAPTFIPPEPSTPSTSSSTCAVAEDPEVTIVEKVQSIPSNVPRTTAWRKRKALALEKEVEAARAEGRPSPKKVRLPYTCKKCGQPQNKETGHSQYYGQTYCPNEEGQIPKGEWLKKKAEERKAKKQNL